MTPDAGRRAGVGVLLHAALWFRIFWFSLPQTFCINLLPLNNQSRLPGSPARQIRSCCQGSAMPQSIVIAAAASAALDPAPITPGWILDGAPVARNKLLAVSRDKTASVVAWECTPGLFNWHYSVDETVCIISGEVFITTADGTERRLGQGDMAFFPAGSSCKWRVSECVRKVAFLRKDLPPPLGLAIRIWHKVLQMGGIRGQMPL